MTPRQPTPNAFGVTRCQVQPRHKSGENEKSAQIFHLFSIWEEVFCRAGAQSSSSARRNGRKGQNWTASAVPGASGEG